jgi:Na+-translocating ferredoxin:NAD+ oxidoreductase RnfG subunit
MRAGEVQGYAMIELHTVRTHPEAFLVVLSPEGSVRSLRVLAFHEPLEYLPPGRWYEQFGGKSLADALRVGGDVHGIVGATLTAQATTRGVRRALALYQVLYGEER